MIEKSSVFVTADMTLALAMTAVGFSLRSVENTVNTKGETGFCFELDDQHNGVDARELRFAFYNQGIDLAARVNEIIETRGITQEEYIFLAFDAARAGLRNRKPVVYALRNNKPLIAKEMPDGRCVIYREGTDKERLKKLIENA